MQPQIYYGRYYSVETTDGTEIIPTDVCGECQYLDDLKPYLSGKPLIHGLGGSSLGWLARLSAPGYLDCTNWTAHETEEEAREYLAGAYGEEEEAL